MVAFPIAATIVAGVFAVSTWRSAATRGTAFRIWSFALLQFAIASGALAWGVGLGWTPAAYRVFYLFGAVLNVVWLALGTVWLLSGEYAGRMALMGVIGLSGMAAFFVLVRGFVPGAIDAIAVNGAIPSARDVMPGDVRGLSRWFSIAGSVVLLGGLVWTLLRRRNALALTLLVLGVLVVAVASEFARSGDDTLFSMGLAVGIALMYGGFMRATS